ncbi:MAG: DUF448 domain-containing protein, partial [Pseudomonadota bacterium]
MRTPHNDPELIQPSLVEPTTTAPRRRDCDDASPERRSGSDVAQPERHSGSGAAHTERRCILSGEHDERAALVRLALSSDGDLLPDIMARAPGRGAWIGVDQSALTVAIAKGRLKGAVARAFKGAPARFSDDLPQQIADGFLRHFLAQLGLAAKANALMTGAERIDQAARSGAVSLLAHASDAAEDGRRKRDQSWRVGEDKEGSALAGHILPVDRTTLSVALGRDNVVHIAITDAAWAKRFEILLGRWNRFTGSAKGLPGAVTEAAKGLPGA